MGLSPQPAHLLFPFPFPAGPKSFSPHAARLLLALFHCLMGPGRQPVSAIGLAGTFMPTTWGWVSVSTRYAGQPGQQSLLPSGMRGPASTECRDLPAADSTFGATNPWNWFSSANAISSGLRHRVYRVQSAPTTER